MQVDVLTVRYGGVTALSDVSFGLRGGDILGIIGPNGAGKTSLFNAISRLNEPAGGVIRVAGRDLLSARSEDVASFGIARTFQNIALYDELTVVENVMLGAHARLDTSVTTALLRRRKTRKQEEECRAEAHGLLDMLAIGQVASAHPGDLPLGTRKRIELARALLARPQILMLDEPANGLTSGEVEELQQLVQGIRAQRDISIMLVEHHMGMVMHVCDQIVVLNFGQVIAHGPPAEIQQNPVVIDAYLGGPA